MDRDPGRRRSAIQILRIGAIRQVVGLGLSPTADTGNALIDAYLWVKIPGESDGECTRGLGPGGTTVDPEWGLIDPAAGQWFPEMALDLVHNANPPLP